ncbi:alpha-amylase family glycosyl hydrolase [Actinopolyspora mortivallis]|uniref:alpha-amylase family glycosyl hydrolase n=1 Tax=Actinopolyspora mortivallis TaxID=33906 RepID=UPI0021598F72|nr:alpha-amylase family glycosyl hydrolase [Actinopolyspora mortivallis]
MAAVHLTDSNRHPPAPSPGWWRNRIFYRVDTRAFNDSDADGIGDLEGVRHRLGYLELIGIEAVWLTGVIASPVGRARQGRDVDPLVGTVETLETLVAEAHEAGIGIVLDLAVDGSVPTDPRGVEELDATLRHWTRHGIDGFRVASTPGITGPVDENTHAILRLARQCLGESRTVPLGGLVQHWHTASGPLVELDLGVDDRFSTTPFEALRIRQVIDTVLNDSGKVGSTPVWTLSNWDHPRPTTRFGGGATGLARARAMALVQFALPGVAGVDNGTELGLPESERPDRTSSHPVRGMIPWEGSDPPFGFSSAPAGWWPTPPSWASSTVETQLEDPGSTLSLHRNAMELRRSYELATLAPIRWYGAPRGCLAFRHDRGKLTCALNTSSTSVPVPPGEIVLCSSPLDSGDRLPPNTAVWLV